MATDERDTERSVPPEGLGSNAADKKKPSKFQPFKKLFGRRKKRETTPDCEDTKLKPSSSFGNVCNGALSSDEETNSGLRSSNYSMGTRAFSHDSIFIPDGREETEESIQAMSQDNILGKVKTLQQQLAKNIKFGQPPQMTVSVKAIGEASTSLEADVLLSSPMETETQQDVVLPESHNKVGSMPDSLLPESVHRTRHGGEEKVTPVKSSSRPKRHHSPSGTIETVNLDAIPLAIARLDNSAAKHKLSVKPKNQRVSKKHKKLSKELQSVSVIEFEPEVLEPIRCEDKVSKQDGHHADKPIQDRENYEQDAKGKRKQENNWVNLETEKKLQMAEAEVKSHMENKRLQEFEEDQRQIEGKKQKLQEEEQCLKMEDRKGQEEKKAHEEQRPQELQLQWHQGQEEQRKKEKRSQELEEPMYLECDHLELEALKQKELEGQKQQEEQRQHEMEEQKQREEQRQCEVEAQQQLEEQRQHELEAQREEEEQRKCELKAQQQEKQRQYELNIQRQQEEQSKCELEAERQQEKQRYRELKAQKKWEEESQRELNAQQEEQRQHELEAQRKQEMERQLKIEAQRNWEVERQHEMEAQRKWEEHRKREQEIERQQEEQRQRKMEAQSQQEEQRRHELEVQKQEEEQDQHEPEAQKQWKEHRQCEVKAQGQYEEQRQKEQEEESPSEAEDKKEQKRHGEIKKKKTYDKLFQHGLKNKRQQEEKQKWQEKQKHWDSEEKGEQELKEEIHKSEKHDERNKQIFQGQKTGQKQKELEQTRTLEGEGGLHRKGRTMKLEKQKRPEQQKENLKAEQMSSNDQKQQELEKQVRSPKHGKYEAAEFKPPLDKKIVQQEELTQRVLEQKLVEQKTLNLEVLQPLEKPKEQDKFSQLQLAKNVNVNEKHLETTKKALSCKEETSQQKSNQTDKGQEKEETLKHCEKKNVEAQEQERILGEELRWQEVDARQTMPRGFTFQVSSGEKQIIFQKVNLSPVTPVKETPAPSTTREFKTPKCIKSSHDLPTSLCVPHTAILVTGAQLCGTAVNLNQIKDTACKSLLGLTEERKTADLAPADSAQKPSPDAKLWSNKMKHAQDPQGNQAILAEWASIRSKILKSAENGKHNEKDKGSFSRHSDDWTPKGRSASHSNLRKTLSANAKFSITPAWQKFSELSKTNTDTENKVGPEAENTVAKELGPSTVHANKEAVHTEGLTSVVNVPRLSTSKIEVHHVVADNTEGCKFAKDLPSFLVPSGPLSKEIPQSETSPNMETQQNVTTRKLERVSPNGEESVSPFGVKLRRTNYSLRFHYDQQAEQKKKKRYSAGDSFDGVPTPLVTPESEQDASKLFSKASKFPSQEAKDAIVNSGKTSSANIHQNYSTATPISLPSISHVSVPSQEKTVCKSPLLQKPALAPKPTSQSPPSSPLSKIRNPPIIEPLGQRVSKAEPVTTWRKTEAKGSTLLSQAPEESKNEEEESREKKSFFPSITMPWREKTEKKTEPLKKERPVLQSRHSIDGSKLMEKVESAQPLWITLALQKQKGFREQQATREERRQAREAKQAEKLAKENASINSQSDNKITNRTNTLVKPAAPEEEKKIETAMSRLERREHLKKSNTLPTSVTVEISNSVPSSPLAKEVTKRFSTPDANPVSTEPAWLALAKRKAKAWSDCPQIIK